MRIVLWATLVVFGIGNMTLAQEATPAAEETVIVTANRYPLPIEEIPAAVTVFDAEQIAASPATTLADLLSTSASLHAYDMSAAGTAPTVDLRGFSSTGETSYSLLLIDGVPLNELDKDQVDWLQLSLDQVERVELIRGPVSAQYGNASMTGVINVVTRQAGATAAGQAEVGIGSWGNRRLGAGWSTPLAGGSLSIGLQRHTEDGWREHSEWAATRGIATFHGGERAIGDHGRLTPRLSLIVQDSKADRPGELRPGVDPRRSDPSFRFNRDDARKVLLGGGADWVVSNGAQWSFDLHLADKDQTVVRTIFFDDPAHDVDTFTVGLGAQYRRSLVGGRVRGLVGLDLDRGRLNSRYTDLSDRDGSRGATLSTARSVRRTLAGYASLDWVLTERWNLVTALRYDRIDGELDAGSSSSIDSQQTATSPSVAVNHRLVRGGNLYASWSRSFKAPTLEQQFDLRSFGGPVLSNPQLEPLRARNLEIGGRWPVGAHGNADVTLYDLDVHDEIGFDFATFRYANIVASRHRGIEASFAGQSGAHWSYRASYAYTRATFRGGENDGRQINAVPKQNVAASLSWKTGPLLVGLDAQHRRDQWIDEANLVPIDPYTLVHLKVATNWGRWTATLLARNLLDKRFVSTGFLTPDETFTSRPALFPGAPRGLEVRLAATF